MKKIFFLLLLISSLNVSSAALIDNIVSYYKWEDATESVASKDGTNVNSPTYTAGKINNALTVVAASSQYVRIPQNSFTYGTSSGCINLWFKLTTTTGPQMIIGDQNGNTGFLIYLAGGALNATKPGNSGLNSTWTADTNWHMITFSASSTGMAMYLDASLRTSNTVTANFIAPSTDQMHVGAYGSAGGSPVAGWYLNGQVDELGQWNRACTPSDITSLYNSGTPGSAQQYPFTASSVTTPSTLGFFRYFRFR